MSIMKKYEFDTRTAPSEDRDKKLHSLSKIVISNRQSLKKPLYQKGAKHFD